MRGRTCLPILIGIAVAAAGAAHAQGTTPVADLVRRALQHNRELAAARLDLERGRGRVRQAGLRPNPTLEGEGTSGRLTGSPSEREYGFGLAFPVELGDKRQARVDVATAELSATEAAIAERERQLARDVLAAHADVQGVLREQRIVAEMRALDEDTVRAVRGRVQAQDASQLELNLLLV